MFVIIVGGGKTGSSVAELLLKEKHRVVVVEHRPDIIERLRQELPPEMCVGRRCQSAQRVGSSGRRRGECGGGRDRRRRSQPGGLHAGAL